MTCGIYSINLGEQDKVYIGQSVDIERRIKNHFKELTNNIHKNNKLQNIFNITKIFNYTILKICSYEELNQLEVDYIRQFNSVNHGYNITSGGKSGRGISHGKSIYSKDEILEVFFLALNHKLTYKDISNITGMPITNIGHIVHGHTHYWLQEEYPEEFNTLKEIKDKHLRRRTSEYIYTKLKSPDGEIFDIPSNIKNFATSYKLDASALIHLLKGKYKTHLGWTGII